jgi:hypothetical protein
VFGYWGLIRYYALRGWVYIGRQGIDRSLLFCLDNKSFKGKRENQQRKELFNIHNIVSQRLCS